VSDLIAARARPAWMLLALCLPRSWPEDRRRGWVDGFGQGAGEASAEFGVYLVGGDVTGVPSEGPVFASTTLGGRCEGEGRGRGGARPGDRLWVTGWPGLAGAGWMADDAPPEAIEALRRPHPPVAFGLALAEATAAMDLSDGLGADLPRLAASSGVGLEVYADAIPAHPAIAGRPDRLRWQIRGGDDFQLLFTAPPSATAAIEALAARTATPVAAIGWVVAGSGVRLLGAEWPSPAFAHFDPGGTT
jgi:thiamine-monophosphate kinase